MWFSSSIITYPVTLCVRRSSPWFRLLAAGWYIKLKMHFHSREEIKSVIYSGYILGIVVWINIVIHIITLEKWFSAIICLLLKCANTNKEKERQFLFFWPSIREKCFLKTCLKITKLIWPFKMTYYNDTIKGSV